MILFYFLFFQFAKEIVVFIVKRFDYDCEKSHWKKQKSSSVMFHVIKHLFYKFII